MNQHDYPIYVLQNASQFRLRARDDWQSAFYQARADWIEERRRRRQDRELIEKKADEFREYQRKYGEQPKKMTTKRPSKFFLIRGDSGFPDSDERFAAYWTGVSFQTDKMKSCIFSDEACALGQVTYAMAKDEEIARSAYCGERVARVYNVRVVGINRIATSEVERSVMWRYQPVVDHDSDHLKNLIMFLERGGGSGYCDNPEDVVRVARQELKRRGRNVP